MSRRWLTPALVAAMTAAAIVFWSALPEQIPTHYNLSGQPDDWMARWPGAFLFPAMGLGIWLLLLGLRAIDPRRAHYEKFEDAYWTVLNLMTLFFALQQAMIVAVGLGAPVDPARFIPFAVGLLFALLGNWLPKIRSNWWMGIRTPWTLESDEVWRSTHRLAGWLFVAAGVAIMAASLVLPVEAVAWVIAPVVTVAVGVPFVYSYVAYRREKAPAAVDRA